MSQTSNLSRRTPTGCRRSLVKCNARRDQRWESGVYMFSPPLGMLEGQYEDTAPHLIVWDMEFRIATQRFQSALETLKMLLEKREKNVESLMFKGRALFLLNRPAEALLLRIQGCGPSKENGHRLSEGANGPLQRGSTPPHWRMSDVVLKMEVRRLSSLSYSLTEQLRTPRWARGSCRLLWTVWQRVYGCTPKAGRRTVAGGGCG